LSESQAWSNFILFGGVSRTQGKQEEQGKKKTCEERGNREESSQTIPQLWGVSMILLVMAGRAGVLTSETLKKQQFSGGKRKEEVTESQKGDREDRREHERGHNDFRPFALSRRSTLQ